MLCRRTGRGLMRGETLALALSGRWARRLRHRRGAATGARLNARFAGRLRFGRPIGPLTRTRRPVFRRGWRWRGNRSRRDRRSRRRLRWVGWSGRGQRRDWPIHLGLRRDHRGWRFRYSWRFWRRRDLRGCSPPHGWFLRCWFSGGVGRRGSRCRCRFGVGRSCRIAASTPCRSAARRRSRGPPCRSICLHRFGLIDTRRFPALNSRRIERCGFGNLGSHPSILPIISLGAGQYPPPGAHDRTHKCHTHQKTVSLRLPATRGVTGLVSAGVICLPASRA